MEPDETREELDPDPEEVAAEVPEPDPEEPPTETEVFKDEVSREAFAVTGTVIRTEAIMDRIWAMADDTAAVMPEGLTDKRGLSASIFARKEARASSAEVRSAETERTDFPPERDAEEARDAAPAEPEAPPAASEAGKRELAAALAERAESTFLSPEASESSFFRATRED